MPAPSPTADRSRYRAADLLRTAFRGALWSTYDHIGLLVIANLLWVALCIPVVTAPAATAGLFELGRRVSAHESVRLQDFFAGFRQHFWPALRIGAADVLAGLILWVNIDFYSHLGGSASLPGMALAGLMVWLAIFYLLMHAHMFPLLIGGERSTKQLLRKSALLTLDNVPFTVGLSVQTLSLLALCVITGAGLVLVSGGLTAVLLTSAHRQLLRKYSDEQEKTEEPETRTFRDLWRPWESDKTRPR